MIIPKLASTAALFILSFISRYYNIDQPRAVVFDEVHYIKFISLYVKRIFFFDSQPPLAKQLLLAAAHVADFKGDLGYSQIGDIYRTTTPIEILRLIPCISGSLVAPIVYLISLELGQSRMTANLVSLLIIAENSLLVQSRFILIEPILILFSTISIYCYLRFTRHLSIGWLFLCCLNAAFAICTKYSGIYTYALLSGLIFKSWWHSIDKYGRKALVRKTLSIFVCSVIQPIIIYILIYYAHLSWLSKAGPHDNIMSSAFQASLENGLASITKGQPLEIIHGSQITLRHTHGRSCWLHSHDHLYPIKYSDGRGSSHQQQVTCYSFKDVNNWWIVKRPHVDSLVVSPSSQPIKDGDVIQLVHGITGRLLNSHDVASAMSPYSQEVSCYIDHNISMPAQDLWMLKVLKSSRSSPIWHTLNSEVQFIHINSSRALRYTGRQLPDWGFHQHEIAADKDLRNDDTIWNVEEHRYSGSGNNQERESDLGQAEFIPLNPTSLTFFEKFCELHYKLFSHNQDSLKDHIYASESPIDWMFMNRGTAYWVNIDPQSNAQIFFIGNPDLNLIGIFSIIIYSPLIGLHLMKRQRQIYSGLSSREWSKLENQGHILLGGYLINVIPYFFYEPPIFLQNYLMAIVFKILVIGALMDYVRDFKYCNSIVDMIAVAITGKILATSIQLSPLSYGSELSSQQLEDLRWKDTWQLISS